MTRTNFIAVVSLCSLAACARDSEPQETETPSPAPAARETDEREFDGVGRIYHYARSNIDGSLREDVYVFRKGETTLEVYKSRAACANAALVTADLNPENGQATSLVGGRLGPNATREQFAFLSYDEAAQEIRARIERDGAPAMTDTASVEHEPWHLFDFDFASLTVATQSLPPQTDFSFGLALAIPEPGREDFLLYLGEAQAAYRGEETYGGAPAHRYALGGPAFGSFGGALWLDAEERHILNVETAMPNHPDYRDFKLELVDIDDGDGDAWRELLTAHFEECD